MTQRKLIASGILALWVGALAILALRELTPSEEKRLKGVAMLIDPVSHYYTVERNGAHIGYGSSQIDTSMFGIRLRNMIVTQPLLDMDTNTIALQYVAQLGPQMQIRDFDITLGRSPNKRQLLGRSVGDSALEIRRRSGSGAPADTIPYRRRAVTAELAPLVVAVGRTLRVGETYDVEMFDRGSMAISNAAIRIEAESLFIVVDSAALDRRTGLWVAAHSDTVRGWKAEFPGEGGGTTWFDRSGRVIVQHLAGGAIMRRTAFEIAFENWKLTRSDPENADSATSSPPSPPPRVTSATLNQGSGGVFY